jgi:hypothetical protein
MQELLHAKPRLSSSLSSLLRSADANLLVVQQWWDALRVLSPRQSTLTASG